MQALEFHHGMTYSHGFFDAFIDKPLRTSLPPPRTEAAPHLAVLSINGR